MARNEYDGQPFFCTTCGGQYTTAGCCLRDHEFVACRLETTDAAMERRAQWLLAQQFDPTLQGTKFK